MNPVAIISAILRTAIPANRHPVIPENRHSIIPAQAGILKRRLRYRIRACVAIRRIGTARRGVIPEIAQQLFRILERQRDPRILAYAAVRTIGMTLLILALHFEQAHALELRGHVKPQVTVVNIPATSLLRDFSDDPAVDTNLDLRLNLSGSSHEWSWYGDYQFLARQGDQL